MGLPVMNSAEWHREFITHLAPERGVLSKAEVMSVSGPTAAYETRLVADKF
jgi:hypothetical protein